jgi:CHASE2 domain-containing sensor protein
VALLLVALNSMLSLVNTSTRAAFLNRSGDSQQKPLAMAVAAMAGAGASAVWLGWWVAPLLALIAAQLSIAWVIEAARRMPATSA